LPFCVDLLLIE